MFVTRRSFIKTLSLMAGAIPLPGVIKQLCTTLVPEEQTLEDAEDILRGLIARCVNGPVDDKEAGLVASFLRRMKPTSEQIDVLVNGDLSKEDVRAKLPYGVRFIEPFTKGLRYKPWMEHNYRTVNRQIMPDVVEVFDRKKWPQWNEREKRFASTQDKWYKSTT